MLTGRYIILLTGFIIICLNAGGQPGVQERLTKAHLCYSGMISENDFNLEIGVSYFRHEQFNKSEMFLSKINSRNLSPQDQVRYYYIYASQKFAIAQYEQVHYFLDSIQKVYPSSAYTDSIWLLRTLAYNFSYRFSDTDSLFEHIKAFYDLPDSLGYFSEIREPCLQSFKKARRFNYFPGGGLFYAKRNKDAISSLALQLATLSYTVWAALNGYYVSSFFTGLNSFLKFHSGSSKGAAFHVHNNNERELKQLTFQYNLLTWKIFEHLKSSK